MRILGSGKNLEVVASSVIKSMKISVHLEVDVRHNESWSRFDPFRD